MSSKGRAAKVQEAKGYRMIVDFDIENFRCFKHAKLRDLRRINLIVGDNASGKTAILEALYLSATAHAKGANYIRAVRNRPCLWSEPQPSALEHEYLEAYWEDIFNDCNHSKVIKANFADSSGRNVNVEISYGNIDGESKHESTLIGSLQPLIFHRKGLDGDEVGKVRIDEKSCNIMVEGEDVKAFPHILSISSIQQFNFYDIVSFYSILLKNRNEDRVIKAFKEEFPQVIDITPLADGPAQSIFVTLNTMKDKRVPLAVVSAGAARYLYYLSAIVLSQNGIVLIDEIENGFYWKKLPKIWKILRGLCVDLNVQLFITTHSNECLQSLLPAMEENVDDFSLIRTEISKGEFIQRQFYGKSFKAALSMKGEVR